MAKWTINGTDISSEFGAYLKKGTYDTLMDYPSVKEYLTEDVREENGERTLVAMQRVKARSMTITFIVYGSDTATAMSRCDGFLDFLIGAGEFDLCLEAHNRTYRLLYQGGEGRRTMKDHGSGKNYVEVAVRFRETNPRNVTKGDTLVTESGVQIQTEGGEDINVNINIYD